MALGLPKVTGDLLNGYLYQLPERQQARNNYAITPLYWRPLMTHHLIFDSVMPLLSASRGPSTWFISWHST